MFLVDRGEKMRRFLIPVLVIALLITGIWGYNQYMLNKDLLRRAESQYQKNFYELVSSMDNINSQLAQTLVSSSPKQIMFSLSNLWRDCFAAKNNMGSIPLAMVKLDKTELLLTDIAEYSYYLLEKNNLEQKKLTEKEWQKIQDLYERSKVIKDELEEVQASVLNKDLSFVDLETKALVQGRKLKNNTIVEGFNMVENKMKAFPDLDFAEGVLKIEPEPRPLKGQKIDQQEALLIAKQFMNRHDGPVERQDIAFVGQGTIPTYGVRTYKKNSKIPSYVEVTQKGGQVIQMYIDSPVKSSTIEIEKALEMAEKFLQEHKFLDMELIDADSNNNIIIFTFIPSQEGVVLYPDMVKVQVALDSGKVISFDQTSYLSYHHRRNIPAAKISPEEATSDMNPNFNIQKVRLALIPSEYEQAELLTYEVRGKIKNETFIIFVNALTGEDERVVRITKPQLFPVKIR